MFQLLYLWKIENLLIVRDKQLEKLGIALISPNVADRLEKARKTNYHGMKRHLQLLIHDFVEKVFFLSNF